MKRYADVIARQKGIRPPAGYATSAAVCRGFLEQHVPKRPAGESLPSGVPGTTAPRKRRRRADAASTRLTSKKAATGRKTRRAKPADAPTSSSLRPVRHVAGETTPLKIPYGNKDIALKLGARYAAGGWYAPRGVDLAPFKGRGWL
jgi:DNA topoisomerase-3